MPGMIWRIISSITQNKVLYYFNKYYKKCFSTVFQSFYRKQFCRKISDFGKYIDKFLLFKYKIHVLMLFISFCNTQFTLNTMKTGFQHHSAYCMSMTHILAKHEIRTDFMRWSVEMISLIELRVGVDESKCIKKKIRCSIRLQYCIMTLWVRFLHCIRWFF